jgi:hypothetical protein
VHLPRPHSDHPFPTHLAHPPPPRLQSCIKKIDPEDIEIDIDAIDSSTFWMVDAFIKDCLPGGKKYSKKKGLPSGAGAAAAAAEQNKAKKSRIA